MLNKRKESVLISTFHNHFTNYPTPSNLSYSWNFGSLAGFCLVMQMCSGFFLASHYTADVATSFDSVEHMMRDVNFGWLFSYIHANGASMFLLVVYIHMARGIFYRSYLKPSGMLWVSGVVLFLLLMGTSFLGYVLPWGQMSFWGATVITNLATAIPFVGKDVAYWLWGGFSVDNATLTRFFSLHFLLPFVMVAVTLVHLTLLHTEGSTNPLGIDECADYLPFYPYFWLKDIFGFFVFLFIFSYLVFFEPNLLGHPDNYMRANALVTPSHIVPEWYFLPFYAILSAVPNKLGGVVLMAASVLILFFLPWMDRGEYVILWFLFSRFVTFSYFLEYFLVRTVCYMMAVHWFLIAFLQWCLPWVEYVVTWCWHDEEPKLVEEPFFRYKGPFQPFEEFKRAVIKSGAPVGFVGFCSAVYEFCCGLEGSFSRSLVMCGSDWDPSIYSAGFRFFSAWCFYASSGFIHEKPDSLAGYLSQVSMRARWDAGRVMQALGPESPEGLLSKKQILVIDGARKSDMNRANESEFAWEFGFFQAPCFRSKCFKFFFFLWVASFMLLGVLGSKPVEYPYSELSMGATFYYFGFLLLSY